METDETRIRRLELQVAELEGRIAVLEDAVGYEEDAPSAADQQAAAALSAAPTAPPPPPTLWQPGAGMLVRPNPPVAPGQAMRSNAPRAPEPSAPLHEWGAHWSPPSAAASGPAFTFSLRDLEERFAGRAMAWIGGAALVGAAVFFLSLAFSRGWINEEMRVAVGLIAGAAALVGGVVMFDRKNPLIGNVLVAVGLGIVSIALFAATRGYGLVAPEFGLAGAFLAALAAAVIAIRYDAREVATFGLLAALAAPPVMGASPNLLTLLFVAVTLVGTTAIALFRTWPYLPGLAFVLAAPQLASYLTGGVAVGEGLTVLVGFWLVNITAAAGEEWRVRRDDLRPSSATLVLANGTFALWGGYTVLTNAGAAQWLGTYVAVAALAHLALGGWFLRRQGLQHLFGNLVAGTGIALVAIAAFIQLGAPAVPVAWAAEATALAWLAVRRHHRWSALAGLALGLLAVGHLLAVEYPLDHLPVSGFPMPAVPWLHAEGGSLFAVVGALLVAAVLVPVRWFRSAAIAVGVLLVEYAAMFEVRGAVLTTTLVLLAVAALALEREVTARGTRPSLAAVGDLVPAYPFTAAAAVVAGAHAVLLVAVTEFPASLFGSNPAVPFGSVETLSLLVLLAGLVAAGRLLPERGLRSVLGAVGVLVIGWTLCTQLVGLALFASLALLLPLSVVLERGLARLDDRPDAVPFRLPVAAGLVAPWAGAIVWTAAVLLAAADHVPPLTSMQRSLPFPPFVDEAAAAGLALTGAALAAARWTRSREGRTAMLLAATAVAAGVMPLEVDVDLVVPLWLALAGIAMVIARPVGLLSPVGRGLALVLGVGAVALAFGVVAPVDRLWVAGNPDAAPLALLPAWSLSLASVALAFGLAGRTTSRGRWSPWLYVAAEAVVVYFVSVAVVDLFQRQVGGAVATEELAKQAQVVMSVCWAGIGVASLAWGLSKRMPLARHVGFGLLAIATAKVILLDLAFMDVAYRALVLAGLGLLLLVGAGLYTRMRGPHAGGGGVPGPTLAA